MCQVQNFYVYSRIRIFLFHWEEYIEFGLVFGIKLSAMLFAHIFRHVSVMETNQKRIINNTVRNVGYKHNNKCG